MDSKTEIARLEEKLRQADIKADPAVIDEVFADDAAITGRDGRMFTKQDVINAHQPAGRQRVTRIDVSDVEIRDHGSFAVVTGRIDLVDRIPGCGALHARLDEARRALADCGRARQPDFHLGPLCPDRLLMSRPR